MGSGFRFAGLIPFVALAACPMPSPRGWFVDADADGYGDWSVEYYSVIDTMKPVGYADNRWDCDDSDPVVNAALAESCADGRDNDCDGLMDCEDDDCEADPGCVELVCDDDLDDDGDGVVDCHDDDCWGTTACLGAITVRSRVLSGQGYRTDDVSFDSMGCHYATPYLFADTAEASRRVAHVRVAASSVVGSVVIESSMGTSTCNWGFRAGAWAATNVTRVRTGVWMYEPEMVRSGRTGFWIDSDCALSTSGFLPRRQTQSSDFFDHRPSGGWYAHGGRWSLSGTSDTDYLSEYDPLGEGVPWSCNGLAIDGNTFAYGALAAGDTFTITDE